MRHFNGILCALLFFFAAVLRAEETESGGNNVGGVFLAGVSEVTLAAPTGSRMRHGGGGVANSVATEVGTLKRIYKVLTVAGRGAWVEFDMLLPAIGRSDSAAHGMLEIQEIHDRRPDVFGYSVLVNDHEVYFRTYKEMGAGPNHYFVQFDRALAPDGQVRVKFLNRGDAPFSLARVWGYSDFFALAKEQETYRRMTICAGIQAGVASGAATLLGETTPDSVDKAGTSEGEHVARIWDTLKSRFEATPYRPGAAFGLEYANRAIARTRGEIDAGLKSVLALGVPYQIVFSGGEWGAHPMGMDGLGGSFADGKYCTIRWDPVAGCYRPTWPYSPGGITGPTWNDRQLQEFLAYRLDKTAGYYADRLAFLKAKGLNPPSPLVLQDWGLGCVPYGDCNDGTVAEARAEGVKLTPEDGLDFEEKRWIYRNLSKVPARSAKSFNQAVGRDAVIVDRGRVSLPDARLSDQYYFHTWWEPVYPFYDDRWALWQTGVGPQVWTTGETGPHLSAAYFDYVAALGKLACVNLERAFFGYTPQENLAYIHTLYERGFLLVTPVNPAAGDLDRFLPAASRIDAQPCAPALHAERQLLDIDFLRDKAPGSPGQLVQVDNLVVPYGRGAKLPARPFEFLHVDDPKRDNVLVYRLAAEGRALEGHLKIEIAGVLRPGDAHAVEVWAGGDPAALHPVGRVPESRFVRAAHWPWTQTATVELGDAMRGRKEWYVKLQLHTGGDWRNVLLRKIKVRAPWEKRSGHPGGEPFTVREARIMKLWLQDRAVYQRLSADYRAAAGEDDIWRRAEAFAGQARYRDAYRMLSGHWAQLLPARFAVRGHGRLGRYPLVVNLSDEGKVALVDLIEAGPRQFEFQLIVEEEQPCEIVVDGLREGKRYSLSELGQNRYCLKRDRAGQAVVEGRIAFTLKARPRMEPQKQLPSRLSGAFAGYVLPEGILVNAQVPELWLDNPIFVPVAPGAELTRTRDGSDERIGYGIWGRGGDGGPSEGDRVDVEVDVHGRAVALRSSFGLMTGRIASFTPPAFKGQVHNGILELEGGARYELDNAKYPPQFEGLPGLKPTVRQNTIEELIQALKPGLPIELRYCPYTYNNRLLRIITIKASAPRNNPKL